MANNPISPTMCPACGAHAKGKFCAECGASLSTVRCPACGHQGPAGARYCNECGASTGTGASRNQTASTGTPAAPGRSAAAYLPWGIAGVALLAITLYVVSTSNESAAPTTGTVGTSGAAPFAPFASGGGNPPDLSSMTPRERASRLYDRIMRYAEQGKTDSLQVFAPMAMASFELLGADLDLDARYDYGRVASEAGQLDIAAAQADTILQSAPNHLLGLALKARTATARGDATTAKKTWATFMQAKDAEMKKQLPEYQMHAVDIEQSTALAARDR